MAGTSLDAHLRGRSAGRWLERLARWGLAAKGVSYGLVAVLAIEVALGSGGQTTTRQGALRAVAHGTLGKIVLVLLAVGFAGYAVWRFTDALLDPDDDGADASGLAKRAGKLARGGVYVALLVTSVEILTSSGGGGGGTEQTQHRAAGVLAWPAGRWLVLVVGLAVAAAAAWNGYRGVSGKFEEKLERRSTAIRAVGTAGHLARGVVFGIVAWFLCKTAVEFDPKQAVSLDGALARLAHAPYGRALLGVVAAGLLAYGLYCLAEARWRKL